MDFFFFPENGPVSGIDSCSPRFVMPELDAQPSTAWSPLRYEVFRALWIAAIVSNIGAWMQNVAGAWLMTSLSSSPVLITLMQTATSLPVFLVVLPAGALADIVDRRKVLLFTQGWMCLSAAGLSVLELVGATTPWSLLGFTFSLGLGAAMNMPVWQAIMPELVPRTELASAVSLNAVAFNIARALGPALGGAIVAFAGSGPVFLLNAMSFLGVIAVIYRWDRSPRKGPIPSEHVISAIRTGARYTLHAPELRAVLFRCVIFIACASALWALMPVVARHELDLSSRGFGALFGCVGAGALVGAAILPRLRETFSADFLARGATIIFALVVLALGYVRNVGVLYGAMIVGGVAWMAAMSTLTVAAQTAAPAWARARSLAFYTLSFQGSMALSSVMWGAIAEREGDSIALLCASIGLVLGVVAAAGWPLTDEAALDLRPSMHWPEPSVMISPDPDEGPVMVMVEYRIDASKETEFKSAMHALARIRRRDGATRWGLFRDLAQPNRYVETYLADSWAEHLRQHTRVTMADRAAEDLVRSFLIDDKPPEVSHFLSEDNR